MPANTIAARRAAKAAKRKAIVAQKRKAELAQASPAGLAARAAALPIRTCLISESTFESGMGTLILARGLTVGPVFFQAYLLDTFCRGVKDTMFRELDQDSFDAMLDRFDQATPLVEIEPSEARKLLRDLVRWSASIGFAPPKNFAAMEAMFGTVDADACETEFAFGQNGKPLYISGPDESPLIGHRAVHHLAETVGTGNFHYIVALPSP